MRGRTGCLGSGLPVNPTPSFLSSPGTSSGASRISGIAAGAFWDTSPSRFQQTGLGSGTVTTSASVFGSPNDLDFPPSSSLAFCAPMPIIAGALNSIAIERHPAWRRRLSRAAVVHPVGDSRVRDGNVAAGLRHGRRNDAPSSRLPTPKNAQAPKPKPKRLSAQVSPASRRRHFYLESGDF